MGLCLVKIAEVNDETPVKVSEEESKYNFGQKKKDLLTPSLLKAKGHFSSAIERDPEYVKPLYQRMLLNKKEEEYEDALADAKKIQELEPSFKGISTTISELEKLHKEKFENMKNEVMGGLKSLGNSLLGNFGMSLDNFKMNPNADGTYNIAY